MKEIFEKLKEFNLKYGHVTNEFPVEQLPDDVIHLRHKLMSEEVFEYGNGALVKKETKYQRAKELADILFVWAGTVVAEGMQDIIPEVFDRVFASNMTKSTEKINGKTQKGPDYKPVDLTDIKELQ